jgi:hypothetical protein
MSSSLRERCQALSESIRKESTIFDRAMLSCSSKDDDDDEREVLKEEQNIGGGDDKARIASAAAVVEHESTKIGLLFANQSKESANEEIKPDVANSALDAFHVSLIAFTAYVNAALTRASKSEGECYAKQVKTIGESVLKASASLIDAVGAKKDTVRSLTASVWEQCKSVEKLPRDGKDAVGKALMTHCRFIKDAKREIEEMLSEGEGENDEDEDDERKGDGEKVEDDFGDVIIREEIKDVDREVLKKAKVTIECTFAFLKALVVPLISTSSNSNSKSRKEHATALNEIEKKCKEIRSAVDEIICEAMPPSDADALASEAKKLKEAAQSMMLAVEEVMTGNEETNPIDAAKKALACVHSACDEM